MDGEQRLAFADQSGAEYVDNPTVKDGKTMTEEERREMTRSNYAAQMKMLGYDASGNPLDMVHVVRCKNCKYSYYSENRIPSERATVCDRDGRDVPLDWYCADGERRENV
jgi:rubredoxin